MTSYWDADKAALAALTADAFTVHRRIDTRWRDNDTQGHVNNAVYYEYFDTAINTWMLQDLNSGDWSPGVLRFVAESGCKYLRELAYPTPILLAHNVARLGRSSAVYEVAIFPIEDGAPGRIAALGRWVHVFVDSETHRPVDIPAIIRSGLEQGIPAR
ncbi:acyl-CoA thioester hydrolase [Microbacterium resistens]|uniref:Acyl-CoA thioester hydrolase n=1 Tax=Microbacterium resistens TaxID=156977 RepID=A0ABU1SAH9_9MICO|nr:thioesterase family protein [Microbacterium resistens]MDR6866620.1 acyl-CoA thioester hydrolase [Microbacterium resistens]